MRFMVYQLAFVAGANTVCDVHRWYLGIQSKKDPAHVMNEVYKAMQALQCVWHQVNNYRVLCQWKYTSGLPPAALTKPSAAAAASPALAALAQLNPLYPQYQHLLPPVAATATNGAALKTQPGHVRRTLGAQVTKRTHVFCDGRVLVSSMHEYSCF